MPCRLRAATPADRPAIAAIVRRAGINPLGLHWSRFVVAEDGGRIVGVGQIKPHGDGSRELASIAVVPDRRGEGIAGPLIRALLESPAGRPPVYLMCAAPLERFYERFGFRRIEPAEMPPYFRRIARLAGAFERIARLFGERRPLIVMQWLIPR